MITFKAWRKISWGTGIVTMIFLTSVLLSHQNVAKARFLKRLLAKELQITQSKGTEAKRGLTCKVPALASLEQFFDYFGRHEYDCSNMRWLGEGEARREVCMDQMFNITPGDCHVLSFGVNNEWSFEDAFADYGCKVFAFDPTMGKPSHMRSPNVRFFNLGIGNIRGKTITGMDKNYSFYSVDRYESIVERLGMTNVTIDYIKMDVELSELDFFQDVFRNSPQLLKNVKQIGMDVHHGYSGEGIGKDIDVRRSPMGPTSAFQLFWQYFQELNCNGFHLLTSRDAGKRTNVLWGRI